MESITSFLIYSILLIVVGSTLALPMRLSFMRKLWRRSPLLANAISLVLSLLAFTLPLIGMAYLGAQAIYVFATVQPHGGSLSPTSPKYIHRDAIITELWLRPLLPPAESSCITQNITACVIVDEFNAQQTPSTWSNYVLMIGIHLIAVIANQWWIERWRKKGGGEETAVSLFTPHHNAKSAPDSHLPPPDLNHQ